MNGLGNGLAGGNTLYEYMSDGHGLGVSLVLKGYFSPSSLDLLVSIGVLESLLPYKPSEPLSLSSLLLLL